MHNAFLNINNRKMSKSEGNFFTVRDVLGKYSGQVLRFFMLSAHYRSPLNFSEELMESAKTSLHRIVNCADNLRYLLQGERKAEMTQTEETQLVESERFVLSFTEAMDDDFNTADAIAAVFELVRFINAGTNEQSSAPFLQRLYDLLEGLTEVLGLTLQEAQADAGDASGPSEEEIAALIAERSAAKKEKNFARADEIRDALLAQGIVLEDTREGVRWKRA